jgi:hypothetical protein
MYKSGNSDSYYKKDSGSADSDKTEREFAGTGSE